MARGKPPKCIVQEWNAKDTFRARIRHDEKTGGRFYERKGGDRQEYKVQRLGGDEKGVRKEGDAKTRKRVRQKRSEECRGDEYPTGKKERDRNDQGRMRETLLVDADPSRRVRDG